MEKRQYIYPVTEVLAVNTTQLMKTESASGGKPAHPVVVKREVF